MNATSRSQGLDASMRVYSLDEERRVRGEHPLGSLDFHTDDSIAEWHDRELQHRFFNQLWINSNNYELGFLPGMMLTNEEVTDFATACLNTTSLYNNLLEMQTW